jgi:hypothetical protein
LNAFESVYSLRAQNERTAASNSIKEEVLFHESNEVSSRELFLRQSLARSLIFIEATSASLYQRRVP